MIRYYRIARATRARTRVFIYLKYIIDLQNALYDCSAFRVMSTNIYYPSIAARESRGKYAYVYFWHFVVDRATSWFSPLSQARGEIENVRIACDFSRAPIRT